MPMSAHGLQADIPGMGWVKTFLFHVWALPSLMFLLWSWGRKAVRVNAGALSGWSKCLAGARVAEAPQAARELPGQAMALHSCLSPSLPTQHSDPGGPAQLPTSTQPQLLPGWGHQFVPAVPAPASLNLAQ